MWLQYSLAVFVGFLYSSLAVPGLYSFLEYSRLAGKYSLVTSKRKISINLKQHYKGGGRAAKQVSRIIEKLRDTIKPIVSSSFEMIREIYALP